jgi:hypothetical protein
MQSGYTNRHGTAGCHLPLKGQYIPLVNHIAQCIVCKIMQKPHRQEEGMRMPMQTNVHCSS